MRVVRGERVDDLVDGHAAVSATDLLGRQVPGGPVRDVEGPPDRRGELCPIVELIGCLLNFVM